MAARYITTDLDLRARFDFTPLLEELLRAGIHGEDRLRKYAGGWSGVYSYQASRHPRQDIDLLLKFVENLSPEGRAMWDRCIHCRFDVGYDTFDEKHYSRWQIEPELLQRIVALNGELVFTIYGKNMGTHESLEVPAEP